MPRLFVLVLLIALPLAVNAQNQPTLAAELGFEAPPNGACPGGWSCSVPETIAADSEVLHGGKWSARIERQADSARQFSTLTKSIPLDFSGCKLEQIRSSHDLWRGTGSASRGEKGRRGWSGKPIRRGNSPPLRRASRWISVEASSN